MIYVSLGTNIGDRLANLQEAVALLQNHPDIQVEKISSIYETEPVGYTDQAHFLNIAVAITTELSPYHLLAATAQVENQLGRTREIHWGPRTMDIDILLYHEEEINTPDLTIPHPRMYERAFVLIPLKEISGYNGDIPNSEEVKLWKQWE